MTEPGTFIWNELVTAGQAIAGPFYRSGLWPSDHGRQVAIRATTTPPRGPRAPQRQFRVLGDAPLDPASHLFQCRAADQAHGAGEDRAVALVTRGL
jgi:hypothetical protein